MGETATTLNFPPFLTRPRIFKATLALTTAGIVVKCGGLAREIVVASIFGRSDAMDALFAALLIPNLLVNLIAESMNQALVPTLMRVRLQEGHARAQQLLSNSMLGLVLALTAACAAMAALAHVLFPVIASGFPAPKLELSMRLFYALLPMVLLSGIASNCTAVLNTLERFALPALVPLVIPIAVVVATLGLHARLGIWAVALGLLAGTGVHAAAIAIAMPHHGYGLRLHWYGRTGASDEVARQFGAVFLSSIVASGGLLVDQAMAATLPAGSVSALVYGGRYVSLLTALLGGAISSAITPYFSTMIAQGDWCACRAAIRRWSRGMAIVSASLALLLIAVSPSLVRVTLQHGAFRRTDTAAVVPVLALYAIQIPFFVVGRVFYRFVVALRRADLVLACGILNLILDVILNLLLMRSLGVAGIALATSLWSISTCALFWFWTRRLLARAEQSMPDNPGEAHT